MLMRFAETVSSWWLGIETLWRMIAPDRRLEAPASRKAVVDRRIRLPLELLELADLVSKDVGCTREQAILGMVEVWVTDLSDPAREACVRQWLGVG